MAAHVCEGCGLLHDMPTEPAEPVELALARIAAEQAIEVERIRAGAVRAEARAAVEVAHEEADATVDAAVAEAELLGEAIEASAGDEDAPAPVEVIAPPVEDEEPEDAPPPAEETHEPHEPRKPRGIGLW